MKKTLFGIITILFLWSCDDGNIIVTTFNFDKDTKLSMCGNDNNKVIYTVNTKPDETISLAFQAENFDGKFKGLALSDTLVLNINNSNKITYRTYNGKVQGDYFCNDVPPSSPQVAEEYTSTSGGQVILLTTIIEQDDNDGVPAEEEDINGNGDLFDDDTDGDGIPNFLDTDDDNDNVPTRNEIDKSISTTLTENGYPDTDGDGVPNYLDEDDDGDGTITRYEDLNAFDELDSNGNPIINPQDDINSDGVPNYLNPDISESLTVDYFKKNIISRTFRTRVIAKNVTMKNTYSDEQITVETLILGYFDVHSDNEVLEMTK